MSEKTVNQDDLAKALSALQNIAKGHSSKGTKTTEVESMRDAGVGAGSSSGATQVYHTPSNSDRASWAGSSWDGVAENGATDSTSENGTDYNNQGKVMKSIMDKIAKGQALTPAEFNLLKGFMAKDKDDDKDMDKAGFFGKDDEDDKSDKKKMDKAKDEDKDMEKSLSDFAKEDETVSKGLEVSEFLAGFANVVNKSLEAMETRIVKRVLGAQARESAENGEFAKSLAEAVVNLGSAITAVSQRQNQLESQPAHAPRSVAPGAGNVLEKGGFSNNEEPLSKALVSAALVSLAERREATVSDVIKFESSGTLSPHLEAKVRAELGR